MPGDDNKSSATAYTDKVADLSLLAGEIRMQHLQFESPNVLVFEKLQNLQVLDVKKD